MALCWVVAPLPWRARPKSQPIARKPRMCESTTTPLRRRKRTSSAPVKRKTGGLLQVLDDLTEKQYGRGQIYYGPRQTEVEPEVKPEEWEELKPDAVLVAGGTGRTGQWVTLGLLNQNFNVRVLTRKFEQAEELFGTSGANVDVFEGDLTDEDSLVEAVRGASSVVCVAGGGPSFFGRSKPPCAEKLVRAAAKAGVAKFVLVGDAESAAVRALRECGLPHVVVCCDRLRDEEGGLQEVLFTPINDGEEREKNDGSITRLDLAQVVCQAMVHHRLIRNLANADPEGGFEFPNKTIHVKNGDNQFEPDEKFWRNKFDRLSSGENVETMKDEE